MTSARQENARTLAAALGLREEEADQLLDAAILITCADGGERLGDFIQGLLKRTLSNVQRQLPIGFEPIVEVIVGQARQRTRAPAICVGVNAFRLEVLGENDVHLGSTSHPIVELLAACYASAATVHRAVAPELPVPVRLPIGVDLVELYGAGIEGVMRPVDLGTCFMAGAGAIGNAVVLGLSTLDVRGELHICDPDLVADGNLNRCWWFDFTDLNFAKAKRLVVRSQPALPRLKLIPHDRALGASLKERGDLAIETLISAVDSRRVRRSLQNEIPHRVFDASTTGISEVVLHYNELPTSDACMSCIYYEAPDETAHEAHVADALGVDVTAVRSNFVSAEHANVIAVKYPNLDAKRIEGLAYDSLFKELCGKGELKTSSAERVLAPFAFVSALAGVMMTLEIVTRINSTNRRGNYNYWRVSPWSAPFTRVRERRGRRPNCEFCGNQILQLVANRFWG